MSMWECLRLALRALRRNRTRAVLTTLGIVIGVGSVIAMMAIGTGARERIAEQLEQMGTNNIVVRAGSAVRSGVRAGAGTAIRLTTSDAVAISELPQVSAVAPMARQNVQLRYRGTNWATRLEGVTPDYLVVRRWTLASGDFFTDWHVANAAQVCVLGYTVARELFGVTDPLGETVIIGRLPCRVLGVLSEKGASSWGRDQDDILLAPLSMVQRKIRGKPYLHNIVVQTSSREATKQLDLDIRQLLRRRHRIEQGQTGAFRIHNRTEIAEASEQSANVFTWLLGSIAAVSLLVGGIGIMNMMLVSVTERTREIGIRMALGARQRDILAQFLLEAILLSGAGGIFGVAMGVVSASLLARFSGLPVTVTAGAVGIAFVFGLLVGVFFGLHPARRAARLQPVDALRYE
ncbi:MAG: ABC transporter permease [Pseudomonadota bacterium]|nr:MAG: ABC transporter permease [Pseudomonadota bacterium]